MGVRTWSNKQINLLKREYATCRDTRELAEKIGKPYEAVKSKAGVLKLHRGQKGKWSKEMDEIMIEDYPNMTIPELTPILQVFNDLITEKSVASRAHKLGLHKSAEFKTIYGRYGRSLQGESWNKGMKGFYAPGSEKGWFKKGGKPGNTLHDGAIVTRHTHKKRGGAPYKWIRISEGKWEMLHVYHWKKKHGAIPKGHIIVFKDRNTLNCTEDCSNYEMITLAENMRRNTIHNLPLPIKQVKQLQGVLNRAINRKQKENEQGN